MLDDSAQRALVDCAVAEIVRGVMATHISGRYTIDERLTQVTNALRFDPTVRNFMNDYQAFLDNAPYSGADIVPPQYPTN